MHYLKWTFPKWGHEWLIIALSTVLGHFLAENLDQLLDTKHMMPIKMIRKRTCASKFISSFEWPVSRRFQSFLCPWWIPLGYVPPLLSTNRFDYILSEPEDIHSVSSGYLTLEWSGLLKTGYFVVSRPVKGFAFVRATPGSMDHRVFQFATRGQCIKGK